MSNFTKETEDNIKKVEKMGEALLDKISNIQPTFTLEQIERAILSSPKHIVHYEPSPTIGDAWRGDITTIEVDMFWFRLFGSNKSKHDEYKKSIEGVLSEAIKESYDKIKDNLEPPLK